MTIWLAVRPDFETKPGGDVVQAQRYARALQERGYPTRVAPLLRIVEGAAAADTVHLFNIDRLVEFAAASRRLRDAGQRIVASPLHHPSAAVEFFEQNVRGGALRVLNRLTRTPAGRERAKHLVRYRIRGGADVAASGKLRRQLSDTLRHAELIAAQAEGELSALEEAFDVELGHNGRVVMNGVDIDSNVEVNGERPIDVVVAGRIEERKNQLRAARCLSGTDFKVSFVGAPTRSRSRYFRQFLNAVEAAPNLEYLGALSREQMPGLYARAAVLFSCSYFEVAPLVDLEAAGYGCQVVTTTAGYSPEYLRACATYVSPTAPFDVWQDAIARARARGINADGRARVLGGLTWDAAAVSLIDAYRSRGLLV